MKWISVKDRLPDDNSGYVVLAFCNDIVGSWIEILHHNGKFFLSDGGKEYPCIVTHWMPLPKPPEDIKEQVR